MVFPCQARKKQTGRSRVHNSAGERCRFQAVSVIPLHTTPGHCIPLLVCRVHAQHKPTWFVRETFSMTELPDGMLEELYQVLITSENKAQEWVRDAQEWRTLVGREADKAEAELKQRGLFQEEAAP